MKKGELKKCTRCGEEKPATTEYFIKQRDGFRIQCKRCFNSQAREDYSLKRKELKKEYYRKNKPAHLAQAKAYRENNLEHCKNVDNAWYEKNKDKITKKERVRYKERYANDLDYKMKKVLRSRLRGAIKDYANKGTVKSKQTMALIGCSLEDLKKHLESQFTGGMSWDNHGEWHIDHIIPCSSFDLSFTEEQERCFCYTNLQPLWAEDNLSKGAKYEEG
jgi:hypothetical protein